MIVLPFVAPERASVKFVFTHFNADNGNGIDNKAYIFLLGLLMSQYTLTGYDASAHMVNVLYFSFFSYNFAGFNGFWKPHSQNNNTLLLNNPSSVILYKINGIVECVHSCVQLMQP